MSADQDAKAECKGIDGAVQGLLDTSTLAAAIAEPEEFVEDYCEDKRVERRRPRVKHKNNCKEKTLNCFKITCVYMLSYIGLTCMVVGYSILGGVLFRALEEENEAKVEQKAVEIRQDFINDLNTNISNHLMNSLLDLTETLDSLSKNASVLMEDETKRNVQKFKNDVSKRFLKVIKDVFSHLDLQNAQNQSQKDQNMTSRLLESKQNITNDFLRFFSGTLVKNVGNSIQTIIRNAFLTLKTSLENDSFNLDKSKVHRFQLDTYELVSTEGWNGIDPDSNEGAKWTYAGGLLYAVTVITTIGYGHFTPKTDEGRAVTILYAIIGIPLTVLCITNIGKGMASFTRAIYSGTFCVECRQQFFNSMRTRRLSTVARDDIELDKVDPDGVSETEVALHEHEEVPIYVSLILVTLYILFGAFMFTFWEDDWSLFESAYFCFITLSTIGFGDFVPGFSDQDWDSQVKQIACSFYLLIGLSTLAMCFDLMQQRGKDFANHFGEFIGLVKKHERHHRV